MRRIRSVVGGRRCRVHGCSGRSAPGREMPGILGSSLAPSTSARPRLSSTESNLSSRTEPFPFSRRESRSTETPLNEAASSMRSDCSRRRARMAGPNAELSVTRSSWGGFVETGFISEFQVRSTGCTARMVDFLNSEIMPHFRRLHKKFLKLRNKGRFANRVKRNNLNSETTCGRQVGDQSLLAAPGRGPCPIPIRLPCLQGQLSIRPRPTGNSSLRALWRRSGRQVIDPVRDSPQARTPNRTLSGRFLATAEPEFPHLGESGTGRVALDWNP